MNSDMRLRKTKNVSNTEYSHALIGLICAISLQVGTLALHPETGTFSPHYLIILLEVVMAILIGFAVGSRSLHKNVYRTAAIVLLLSISAANIWSLAQVLNSLIYSSNSLHGVELLMSAVAIFLTNIIVYAIWYWEIDSPGFTSKRWTANDKDFQFTQQDMKLEFGDWQPQFVDYLYLSLTNAINFAPADARPITHTAKLLMGSQALISVFTLALLVARSVSILGS